MRIGLVIPDARPGGGVAEKALFVARSLQKHLGADVRLFSLATSSVDGSSFLLRRPLTSRRRTDASYAHEEFEVGHFGALAAEIEAARYAPHRQLVRRASGCDVLHVVAGTPAWGWAVSRFEGPVVLHFASFARYERVSPSPGKGAQPVDAWRRLMTRCVTVIERVALKRATVVITVNQTRRREVQAQVPGTQVETVHTGVDTNWFTPGPYVSAGYWLSVGRLSDPRKNVPLLLRAYAAARARFPGLPRLVLAGHTGPSAECWRLIAALGLSDAVDYRGPLNRVELARLYRGASAYLLSSDEEGQGIVVLEAMASGLPVIATSCIGPQELVTSGVEGFLVPVGAIGTLADAMVRLGADEELRQRMSHAARARAVTDFSLDSTGARLCEVYAAAGIVPRATTASGDVREMPVTA